MAVAWKPLVDQVEIGVRAVLEADSVGSELVDGCEDVVRRQCDMLDSLALIFLQELLDLAVLVLGFVQWNPDLVVGSCHGA